MKVLVIGAGAREHALVRSLANDPVVSAVFAAPGNPGIGELAELRPVDVADASAIASLAIELGVDLVVIGPEVPLVSGAADAVRAAGVACFGPSAAAAQLEGSKAFAKQVMHVAGVPTARSGVATDIDTVSMMLDEFGAPHVVKDDGLAAGKGVIVTDDRERALEHARACFAKKRSRVVIEEFLDGPEVSLFCVTDGTTVVPLEPAQDFKRVGDDDFGPNTGGMGAYSPLPWAPAGLVDEVVAKVAQPTINEMARRGTPFTGLLYIGLALTSTGTRVIEFNARFGDPETQVVLARLQSPLAELLMASATGTLAQLPPLQWDPGAAVTVVVAAENYPEAPVIGDLITGIEAAESDSSVHVLHAGTRLTTVGDLVSAGGRVLSIVGQGDDLAEASALAYAAVGDIFLRGSHYRSDIARAAVEGEITVPVSDRPSGTAADATHSGCGGTH